MELKEMLGSLGDQLSVRRAFGEGYEKDGALVVPVAFVAGGGGGGESHDADEDREDHSPDEGHDSRLGERRIPAGAGGGFGGVVIPLGVYVIKDERVRFVPTINPTLIALAAMALVGVLARRSRRRCAHR